MYLLSLSLTMIIIVAHAVVVTMKYYNKIPKQVLTTKNTGKSTSKRRSHARITQPDQLQLLFLF